MRHGLQVLLDLWQPSFVVVKQSSKPKSKRTQRCWANLLNEVCQRRITMRRITEQDIQRAFANGSRVAKYALASMLVRQFPFLAAALPPARKIWKSEDYRMSMFVAVSLALAASGYIRQIPDKNSSAENCQLTDGQQRT